MTATLSKILEADLKGFNCSYFENMEGIEAVYKSITGFDYNVQMQAWKNALNDPESYINKTIRMWSAYSKNIDYEKLTGLQAGVLQFVDQLTRFDTNALSSLKTEQLFDTDTEIGKHFIEVYDCAYETEKEIEESDIGKEELKSNVIEEIDNNDANKYIIRSSVIQKAEKVAFNIICSILLITFTYLCQAGEIENTLVNDVINHIINSLVVPLLVSSLYDNFKTINLGIGKIR